MMDIDTKDTQYREFNKIFDESWDDPLTAQVGGNHYKNLAIQPVEYITANNLSYLQGSVIKYVTRYKDKNGIEDLQKAIHFVKMMIQEEEDKK
tara:strand:- start:41 stop:319 length:279 start_codon:yes stop_codon:yes gene_type:complete